MRTTVNMSRENSHQGGRIATPSSSGRHILETAPAVLKGLRRAIISDPALRWVVRAPHGVTR